MLSGMQRLDAALEILGQDLPYRYDIPPRFVYAFCCVNAPKAFGMNAGEFIQFIVDHEKPSSLRQLAKAVGGSAFIIRALEEGVGVTYNRSFPLSKDWAIEYTRSQFPDGTQVFVVTHSRIEHVFVPTGYQIPQDWEAPPEPEGEAEPTPSAFDRAHSLVKDMRARPFGDDDNV